MSTEGVHRREPSALPAAFVRVGVGGAALVLGVSALPGALWAPWAVGMVAALAFLVGWRTVWAGTVLGCLLLASGLAPGGAPVQVSGLGLGVAALLLAAAGAGRGWSLDARGAGRGAAREWPLLLLRMHVSVMSVVWWLPVHRAPEVPGGLLFAAAAVAGGLWLQWTRTAAIGGGLLLHLAAVGGLLPIEEALVAALFLLPGYLLFLGAETESRLLIWDDHCSFCAGWVRRIRTLDWMQVHRFAGSSDAAVLEAAGVTREEADRALQHIGSTGRSQGYDGVQAALQLLPATFLLAPFMGLPGVKQVGRRIYRRVAEGRHCMLPPARDPGRAEFTD